jgi:antitoxin (DNA-binding transcriptional repressor) of toxin-antitoxin stability system
MLITQDRANTTIDNPKIYTMRELNQSTAQVIDEINRSGRPAAITKHGRLVALITPLAGVQVESIVLSQGSQLAEQMEDRATDSDPMTYSSEEVLERFNGQTD